MAFEFVRRWQRSRIDHLLRTRLDLENAAVCIMCGQDLDEEGTLTVLVEGKGKRFQLLCADCAEELEGDYPDFGDLEVSRGELRRLSEAVRRGDLGPSETEVLQGDE